MRRPTTTPLSMLLGLALAALPAAAAEPVQPALATDLGAPGDASGGAPADGAIAAAVGDPALKALLADVLDRNPRLAAARAEAAAAAQRAPQAASLPDPMAGITLYLQTPETRVGPQQAMVSLSQRFPWFGKLDLREQAALYEAAAAAARVDAIRLELVTEARRLAYELAFLDAEEAIVREDADTLGHFEELARARYATGVGLGQSVVKIQAEITRDQTRLLGIDQQRAGLLAELNALRDRPETAASVSYQAPSSPPLDLDAEALRRAAATARPETAAARARISAAATRVELARKDSRPDLTAGLSYVMVGGRDDTAGRLNPPEDNGKDILGVSASVNLPVWRKRLAAGVEEATQRRLAAEESLRDVVTAIDRAVDDLVRRIPLIREELDLYEKVLLPQARESLNSALAGYSSGTLDALDLLDAERVLLQVRIAAARTRTDHAIAIARLEGAVAQPVANGDAS